MKKIIFLVLFASLFSLIGCKQNDTPVKYTSISEEEFLDYFSEEAKSVALANFSTISRIRLSSLQNQKTTEGYKMKYILNKDVDEKYYYMYAKMEDNSGVYFAHELYVANEEVDECKYYENSSDGKIVKTGNLAVNLYNEGVNGVRNIVTNSINDYTYLTDIYIRDPYVVDCFKGSDKSIKAVCSMVVEDYYQKATTIFDSETLLVKSFKLDMSNENGKGSIKMDFKYNVKVPHKTPKDIGF